MAEQSQKSPEAEVPFTGKISVVKKVQIERDNRITSIMVDLNFKDGVLVGVSHPHPVVAGQIQVLVD
jgi:hypothetical protein